MNAIVVYESLWSNTAAVARAIAEGMGNGTRAFSTAEATADVIASADVIVAGAPTLGFRLPTDKMREGIRANPGRVPSPPDLSHPSMQSWLAALPHGHGWSAAFDTQVRGPFGSAATAIAKALEEAGYKALDKPAGFTVTGKFGPLKDGELVRATLWGRKLAKSVGLA